MKITNWADQKVKKFDLRDIQLIKLSVFSFTLMLAKIWEPILSLEWYWYAVVFILATIRPALKMFGK
ncbi:MAG: hypothetical protein KAJ54_00275 [Candidatus Aenigmarchaeota archaeon]|nr:hypothetical protein [Candidatus Aenigmarchaeota archaeon]MCK5322089.1 hypothetical protein [Candidatus Aenigmarchaeota archaeon]